MYGQGNHATGMQYGAAERFWMDTQWSVGGCWFGGSCMEPCPVPGAIEMEHPLNQRVAWKRKETGEYFRIGMKNPPPPNTRPPVGGWRVTPGVV